MRRLQFDSKISSVVVFLYNSLQWMWDEVLNTRKTFNPFLITVNCFVIVTKEKYTIKRKLQSILEENSIWKTQVPFLLSRRTIPTRNNRFVPRSTVYFNHSEFLQILTVHNDLPLQFTVLRYILLRRGKRNPILL